MCRVDRVNKHQRSSFQVVRRTAPPEPVSGVWRTLDPPFPGAPKRAEWPGQRLARQYTMTTPRADRAGERLEQFIRNPRKALWKLSLPIMIGIFSDYSLKTALEKFKAGSLNEAVNPWHSNISG